MIIGQIVVCTRSLALVEIYAVSMLTFSRFTCVREGFCGAQAKAVSGRLLDRTGTENLLMRNDTPNFTLQSLQNLTQNVQNTSTRR